MKSIRGVRLRYFALVLSIIVIGIGVWQTFFAGQGYVKTEATIISIEENEFSTVEDTSYDVTVQYSIDGVEYTGLLGSYSPSYAVGKTVSIKYDPNDPAKITDGSGMSFIFLIIGVVILTIVIATWVLEKKNQKTLDKAREATEKITYAPSVQGEQRELYFITDLGTPKYGHRLEDKNRNVLYEAKCTKFTMLQPMGFEFIDHEHNITTPHLIGHRESSEWNSLIIDDNSSFTFDGENIWKHLKRNGISVDSTLNRDNMLKVQFEIYRNGQPIASARACGKYAHEEDEAAHGKASAALPAYGHYRVFTAETNLDLLFLTLLAFTRSEATTDEGGNRRTVWNTIKQG